VTRPKAILFDLDDTLVPEFASYSAAFAASCSEIMRRHGIEEAALWSSVRDVAREVWRASPVIDYCQHVRSTDHPRVDVHFAPSIRA
jgi:FMN phosphatase YigB (HAD superfamily)